MIMLILALSVLHSAIAVTTGPNYDMSPLRNPLVRWTPGNCFRRASSARCCEHEAYWCGRHKNSAWRHCQFCVNHCLAVPNAAAVSIRTGSPFETKLTQTALEWGKICQHVLNFDDCPSARACSKNSSCRSKALAVALGKCSG